MPTRPGISVRPARSSVDAPPGIFTPAASPRAVMRPPSMITVWSSLPGAPVPSITRACVSATTGASGRTKVSAPPPNAGISAASISQNLVIGLLGLRCLRQVRTHQLEMTGSGTVTRQRPAPENLDGRVVRESGLVVGFAQRGCERPQALVAADERDGVDRRAAGSVLQQHEKVRGRARGTGPVDRDRGLSLQLIAILLRERIRAIGPAREPRQAFPDAAIGPLGIQRQRVGANRLLAASLL